MINSLQNAKVKAWMRLYQKKYRDQEYLIFEPEIISEAHRYGYLKTLVYCGDCPFAFAEAYEVSPEVMQKLTKGLPYTYLGIATKLVEKPFAPQRIVILDDLQDPYNVGMIMQSAELFGYDTVVLGPNCADIYLDKCLNASRGSIYHLNIIKRDLIPYINELKTQGFKVYATGLTAETKELEEVASSDKMAFVLGNEGSGVKKAIFAICDEIVKIRMENIDSLNVAIAGTIVMYHFANKER